MGSQPREWREPEIVPERRLGVHPASDRPVLRPITLPREDVPCSGVAGRTIGLVPDGPNPPSAIERQRQAAALNHLLGEIGLTSAEQTKWWNLVGYKELGGRTPTQAWLAGDENSVRALVEQWYEASHAAAAQLIGNEQYLLDLRRKLKELDDKYGSGIIRSA